MTVEAPPIERKRKPLQEAVLAAASHVVERIQGYPQYLVAGKKYELQFSKKEAFRNRRGELVERKRERHGLVVNVDEDKNVSIYGGRQAKDQYTYLIVRNKMSERSARSALSGALGFYPEGRPVENVRSACIMVPTDLKAQELRRGMFTVTTFVKYPPRPDSSFTVIEIPGTITPNFIATMLRIGVKGGVESTGRPYESVTYTFDDKKGVWAASRESGDKALGLN